jgi:hypothetical protein
MLDSLDNRQFLFELPLWFAGLTTATTVNDDGKRVLVDIRPESLGWCRHGGDNCLLAFTDEDLAEKHADLFSGKVVPLEYDDEHELKTLLAHFYPRVFRAVVFDPEPGRPTNKRILIPELIRALEQPIEYES